MTFSDKKDSSKQEEENDEYFNKRKTLKTRLLEKSCDDISIQDNQKNKLNKKYNKKQNCQKLIEYNNNTKTNENEKDIKLKSEEIQFKNNQKIINNNQKYKIDSKLNLESQLNNQDKSLKKRIKSFDDTNPNPQETKKQFESNK